jgi:ABC-type uncharacterized transport system YnjBCD permease subunit
VRVHEPDRDALERAAGRARAALGLLQLGGVAFLAVIALGFVPRIVAATWTELEGVARGGALAAAALVAIGSVIAGMVRLHRMWPSEQRTRDDDAAPPR